MPHENVYGICENMCKVPVSPKTKVDEIEETLDTLITDITAIKVVSSLPQTGVEGTLYLCTT